MLKFNKKTVFLIALPLILFALILYAQSRKPRLLPGVGGNITAIAFSPDGKNVVCASNNNYVQIWLADKEKWRSFYNLEVDSNHQSSLCVRLRFSTDGKTLFAGGAATGGSQAYSQVWDVATRRRKFAFNPTNNPVFDVSPDGRFAVMSQQNAAYAIDLNANPQIISQKKFQHPQDAKFIRPSHKLDAAGEVTCAAFSPDGKTLAIGDKGFQSPPSLWSVETGQRVAANFSVVNFSTMTFLEWSPDGKKLAAAFNGGVAICDLEGQGTVSAQWPQGTIQVGTYMGDVVPIAWSPDGKTIFTGGDEVRRWRASDLKIEYSYGVSGPVAVSPDGRTMATASWPDPGAPKGVLLWKIG